MKTELGLSLAEALARFQTHRSAQLTRVITELGAAAVEGFVEPHARTNVEFHGAWVGFAQNAQTRSWALERLITKLFPPDDKVKCVVARFEVLQALEADPRIAKAVLDLFELKSPVTGFRIAHEAMARLIAKHADDETAEVVNASPGLPEEVKRLALPAPVALPAKWALPKASKPDADGAALWAAVYARLDDDAPRAVLADWLQERNDPRGELIALQLIEQGGTASEQQVSRAQALTTRYGSSWLGALRSAVQRAQFHRGFVQSIELDGSFSPDDATSDPQLATVEVLTGKSNGHIAQFLKSPVVRSALREIVVEDDAVWAQVPFCTGLTGLQCTSWSRHSVEERFLNQVLPFLEGTPAITRVGARLDMLRQFSPALKGRITSFRAVEPLQSALAVWHALPKLTRLTAGHSGRVELHRAGRLEHVRINGRSVMLGVEEELALVPKSISRVEVVGNKALTKRLSKQLGDRFEVVDRLSPSGLVTGVKG